MAKGNKGNNGGNREGGITDPTFGALERPGGGALVERDTENDDLLMQYGFDVSKVITEVSKDDFKFAQDQGLIGERLVILKAKDVFKGTFLGKGTPHVMMNKRTGEEEPLDTWLFKHLSGMYVKVLSTFQLDREMPNVKIGQLVQLIHGGSKETNNGNRVNDILVMFPRPNPLDAARSDPNVIDVSASDVEPVPTDSAS